MARASKRASVGAMFQEENEDEKIRRLKRDAAIRQKDQEFERKRHEEEERKRKQLAQMKEDYDNREKESVEKTLAYFKKMAEIRASRKAEQIRLTTRRDDRIEKKKVAWRKRADAEIQSLLQDAELEEDRIQEALAEARARKHKKADELRKKKREQEEVQDELEIKREEKEGERDMARLIRAIRHVDEVKEEAHAELHSFIQHPFPVPLKQVLAGRVRPVPKVTELLAAYKDAREDLEDLQQQDIPMRAQLRNQSLFTYVRDIQQKAEADRIRPPEPMPSDLGRGTKTGPGKRSPGSPKKSGSNWKAGTKKGTR